jgi:anti-sigma-K factor RskA
VVTDQGPGHDPFAELAAGYVLNALEPADEQLFLRHAGECPDCMRTLADYREVVAALADTAPPAEPSPQLADRIMAAALADLDAGQRAAPADADTWSSNGFAAPEDAVTARDDMAARQNAAARQDASATPGESGARQDAVLPPNVVPLRPRSARWLRPAAAVAASALIAGGIWGGLAATSGSNPQPAIASCAHIRGCSQVILTAAGTHTEAGKVLVKDGVVTMVPTDMKADDTADQIYVLWQITGKHPPFAVGSFDVRPGSDTPIRVGDLSAPYAGTQAFAVSLEHGRTIPPSPSTPVALGEVT